MKDLQRTKDLYNLVKIWHEKYGVPRNDKPSLCDFKTRLLRYTLMEEELQEYQDAIMNDNLVEIADALMDLLFVVLGSIDVHGFGKLMEKMFTEVWNSNMTKEGNLRDDGKILKGASFVPPNLEQFL